MGLGFLPKQGKWRAKTGLRLAGLGASFGDQREHTRHRCLSAEEGLHGGIPNK